MPEERLPWLDHFAALSDPRVERGQEHPLLSIVGVAPCATLGGADDWAAVERFGNAKLDWFRRFLELPNGIPSHDTFGRVFARLDPDQFEAAFRDWVAAVAARLPGLVALDGKTLIHMPDETVSSGLPPGATVDQGEDFRPDRLEVAEAGSDRCLHVLDGVEQAAVGGAPPQLPPEAFDRVEVGAVAGQPVELQVRVSGQRLIYRRATVPGALSIVSTTRLYFCCGYASPTCRK
jgi:hypothetical protein